MRFGLMAALAPLCLSTAAAAADIPLATVVRFNTVCARCHEGECSGRLSFDHGQESSGSHIRRHAGDVSPSAQGDLYALLVHMKRACAYFPMPASVPKDRHWPADALAMLRSPAGDAYFVPLGELATGRYRARLRFDAAAEACAQVISESFDSADFAGLALQGGTAEFIFDVERKGSHYLRLQTGKPAPLIELEIVPDQRGAAAR